MLQPRKILHEIIPLFAKGLRPNTIKVFNTKISLNTTFGTTKHESEINRMPWGDPAEESARGILPGDPPGDPPLDPLGGFPQAISQRFPIRTPDCRGVVEDTGCPD